MGKEKGERMGEGAAGGMGWDGWTYRCGSGEAT